MSGKGIPFSNFYDFSGNTVVWLGYTSTASFSGTMDFLRDPTVNRPMLINNDLNKKYLMLLLSSQAVNKHPRFHRS